MEVGRRGAHEHRSGELLGSESREQKAGRGTGSIESRRFTSKRELGSRSRSIDGNIGARRTDLFHLIQLKRDLLLTW